VLSSRPLSVCWKEEIEAPYCGPPLQTRMRHKVVVALNEVNKDFIRLSDMPRKDTNSYLFISISLLHCAVFLYEETDRAEGGRAMDALP
jgi:hypothetical protein